MRIQLLIMLFCLPLFTFGQVKYSISGQVMNAETGQPLTGVSIIIHELQRGEVTNEDGEFRFENIKPSAYNIHFQYIGFEAVNKQFRLRSDTALSISLKPSPLETKEVVVETDAMRLSEKENSLSMVTAHSHEITRSGEDNVPASLQQLPGVNFIQVGTGVAKPVIRGLSFNRLSVIKNGIKQEGQQWGTDHGLEIDQNNIDRVEVIKGPSAVMYGSDAIGGVINLKTESPVNIGGHEGKLNLSGATNTNMWSISTQNKGNFNGWVYDVRASKREYGDYRVPASQFEYNNFILPIAKERLKNTAGKDQSLSLMAGRKGDWGYTRINASVFDQKIGFFPGAHGRPDPDLLQSDNDFRDIDYPFQEVTHYRLTSNSNIVFGDNWLEIDLGYQKNQRLEREPVVTLDNGEILDDLALQLDLNTLSAQSRFHHYLTDSLNFIYGIRLQNKENISGGRDFLIPGFMRNEAGGFIFSKWKSSEKTQWSFGLRLDGGSINTDQGSQNGEIRHQGLSRSYLAWAGSAGFAKEISHHWLYKVNLGSSYRYPTVAELASNGLHHGVFRFEKGDENLKAERSYQLDLGIDYHQKYYWIRLTPFISFYDNFIYLSPSGRFSREGGGQVFEYQQGSALHTGGELSGDYHLGRHWHFTLSSEYVFAQNLDTWYPIPFIPPWSNYLTTAWRSTEKKGTLKNYSFELRARHNAAQNRTARNEFETPAFLLFDFNAEAELMIAKRKVNLLFTVTNILNTPYLRHLSRFRQLNLPEPGRNFRLNISIPLYSISPN